MGSTRLPGKILRVIHTKTLLDHILFRLTHLASDAAVVIATSDRPNDDVVEQFCWEHGVACYRGSEGNVLDRYYQCARHHGFSQIVRLTADNPFTDIEELDRLITLHLQEGNDFSNSFASLPIGVGAEIFTFAALERSAREGHEAHHVEHVDEYMIEHPELFKTGILAIVGRKCRPEVRLTVDTEEDYRRACRIVAAAADEYVTTEEAIESCSGFA